MSKKVFKSQASSSRAVFGAYSSHEEGFGSRASNTSSILQGVSSSSLSYVYEPPDLSGITDSNIVILFKNVQKKDATTKAKGLEELHSYVQNLTAEKSSIGVCTLEAWISIYPRTSIDSSRRVRQLAHILQGQISLLCGKGIAKYLPKLIGAWLAGLNDNDKLVANAAREAFRQTFPSEEKQQNAWKVFRTPILDHCRDVLFDQTVTSLSDERTTSLDDAEAKYARVLGSAISTIVGTIENLSIDEIHKESRAYQDIVGWESLWKLATYQDPFVRKSLYRLIAVLLQNDLSELLDMKVISKYLVFTALRSDQRGSAYEYSKMLVHLSLRCPEVWTVHTESTKNLPRERLCHFLAKGSQGAPADFWKQILTIVRHLPPETLSPMSSNSDSHNKGNIDAQFLEAIHEGLLGKEESKLSQAEAWSTYLELVLIMIQSNSSPAARLQLLEAKVVPIIEQYLRPDEERRRWDISGSSPTEIVTKALYITLEGSSDGFREVWNRLSELFIHDIQTSLPEQSHDYAKSQDEVGAKARKWYNFQAVALKAIDAYTLSAAFTSTTEKEMQTAIDVLVARNGKPYSAANSIAIAVRSVPQAILQENKVIKLLSEFLRKHLAGLALSPSLHYLVTVVDEIRATGGEVQGAYRDTINSIVNSDTSIRRNRALKTLFASSWLGEESSSVILGDLVKEKLEQSLKGHEECWDFVALAMANPAVPAVLAQSIISTMVTSLSIDEQLTAGLRGLNIVTKRNMTAIQGFSESLGGSALLSRLLLLSDSPSDAISTGAKTLYKSIEDTLVRAGNAESRSPPMIRVIRDALFECGIDSVSIATLVEETAKLIQRDDAKGMSVLIQQILPSIDQWYTVLEPFMIAKPNTTLAMTNQLGGTLHLIDFTQEGRGKDHIVSYDLEGYSLPIRIISYMTNILKLGPTLNGVKEDQKSAILEMFSVFAELATDGLSVHSPPGLWKVEMGVESEIGDLLADTQSLLSANLQSHAKLAQQLWARSEGTSVASYYSARAYATLINQITEISQPTDGSKKQQALQSFLEDGKLAFNTVALLTSAIDLKLALKLCNGWIDTIAEVDLNSKPLEALSSLILLNCLIASQEDLIGRIPQRRLVFHVKHLSTVLQNVHKTHSGFQILEVEVHKNLIPILTQIPSIYRDFWETTMNSITLHWSSLKSISDEDIPAIYTSLKLYAALENLSSVEINDDFYESWAEKREFLTLSMIRIVKLLSDHPDEFHQPRRMVNDLLKRLIVKRSPPELADVSLEQLCPIMACKSDSLQDAAFKILHDKIPSKQEQISMEAALSDDYTAKLPEELLSLIVAIPVIDLNRAASSRRGIPLPLRTYLLTWLLVFDHWNHASYRVQNQYADYIKTGSYVKNLLDYIFDNIITQRLRPVDASRFAVDRFDLHEEDSLEREVQWLLCHLYYLCLLRLPLLSKAWWRDETSRKLQRPVEEWTAKYITPAVITTTIKILISLTSTVEEPLEVKAQLRAKEVVATYPIDDQFLSIKLPLPPTYPLASITVLTSNRIGIEEKKWHSWLLTISGIINFPTSSSTSLNTAGGAGGPGAILDGILVWRRNVEGALKGQSECSICYSVVGTDRQLPNKRCGTCRNFFHGGCLYRWFRSSNSSSCPLCRNAFNYS